MQFPLFPELMTQTLLMEQGASLQAADRRDVSLARGHADVLFSDAQLLSRLLSVGCGRHDESLRHRRDIEDKIEREGLEGYLQFLMAALNQHWAPVVTFEALQEKAGPCRDEEMLREHRASLSVITGLLSAIETDELIQSHFQKRWVLFSPKYSLDDIRQVLDRSSSRQG